MENKFTLYHLALYAKHWYKRSPKKTLWDDLAIIMSLDNYSGEYMSKSDMVFVILNQCQRLNIRAFNDLHEFATGVAKENVWKYGYYTKDCNWLVNKEPNLPEYDYPEAIIRYCLSNLLSCDKKTLTGDENGKLPMPNYKTGLYKNDGITKKKLKEMFA